MVLSWLFPVQESMPPFHKHAPYVAIAPRGSIMALHLAMAVRVSSADLLEKIISTHADFKGSARLTGISEISVGTVDYGNASEPV